MRSNILPVEWRPPIDIQWGCRPAHTHTLTVNWRALPAGSYKFTDINKRKSYMARQVGTRCHPVHGRIFEFKDNGGTVRRVCEFQSAALEHDGIKGSWVAEPLEKSQ